MNLSALKNCQLGDPRWMLRVFFALMGVMGLPG
jgi:hypothetical protein